MASKWGTTVLNVFQGTFRPHHVSSNGISEIALIPSPENNTPLTVLQQAGRERKRIKLEAYVESWSEYNTLLTDYTSGTIRLFTDDDTGINSNHIIQKLGEPEYVNSSFIRYSMELIES